MPVMLRDKGLKEAQAALQSALDMLQQFAKGFKGVELTAKPRNDGADTETIVDELIDRDRDFFTPDTEAAERIAQIITNIIETNMQILLKAQSGVSSSNAIAKKQSAQQIRQITGQALIKAMQKYMQIVTDRIRAQRTASGGSPRGLTLAYRKQKLEKFGFAEPIGVASRQLLENLSAGNLANIRLKK